MGNISKAWDSVKYFWTTETPNFYLGILSAVLTLLNLTSLLSAPLSAVFCPFISVAFYVAVRFLMDNPAGWRGNKGFRRDVLAVFLGAVYTAPFILL